MRIILARGPVVRALARHDPGLRVRWSFEKKKWAVEAKAKRRSELMPPVFFERLSNGEFVERLLPELSERYISYHDGYYVVCWAKKLDWALYEAVVDRDTHRNGDAVKGFDAAYRKHLAEKESSQQKIAGERSREAYEKFKWLNSRRPWGDPVGA